jgi:hypothetical protein
MSEKYAAAQNVANLRLPVPFFDLLMVLLVTCLVFVAPLRPETETTAIDIAIAQGKASPSPAAVLPVIPRATPQGWVFEISGEGQMIAAEDLGRRAAAENRKIVLVVPPATAVQDFVNMQMALSAKSIPFALAIKNKEAAP